MIPWKLLDKTQAPKGGEMTLHQRGGEFSIRINGLELMNSRAHDSEGAMARLACAKLSNRQRAIVLVGGLGMGFTLAAALKQIGHKGRVVAAELVPTVVDWNRGVLAHLAGNPLKDNRVTVLEIDVALILKEKHEAYDAILLDVDNGPDGLTKKGNNALYQSSGLNAAFAALKPGGVLAVWSAGPDNAFTKRLNQAGFKVEKQGVRARRAGKGGLHTIWIAKRKK